MERRLAQLEPVLPYGAPTNYRGGYALEDLRRRTEEARLESGKYYLLLATAQYGQARAGNKLAARAAYGYLKQAMEYVPEEQAQHHAVVGEMYDLGIVHIRVYLSGADYLLELADESIRASVPNQTEWTMLHYEDYRGRVDYEAEIVLLDASTWGPSESSSSTTYSKEVLDYVEKQEYEEHINDSTVVKKVREIEHFKTVTGTATRVDQSYDARVDAELHLYNVVRRRPQSHTELAGQESWSHSYTACSGDSDALSGVICLGSASIPPGEHWMLLHATQRLLDNAHWKLFDAPLP